MVALSIWPRGSQPVVAVTFHTRVSQSFPRSRNHDEPDEEDLGPEDHNRRTLQELVVEIAPPSQANRRQTDDRKRTFVEIASR
jgi:hypothetical protein